MKRTKEQYNARARRQSEGATLKVYRYRYTKAKKQAFKLAEQEANKLGSGFVPSKRIKSSPYAKGVLATTDQGPVLYTPKAKKDYFAEPGDVLIDPETNQIVGTVEAIPE